MLYDNQIQQPHVPQHYTPHHQQQQQLIYHQHQSSPVYTSTNNNNNNSPNHNNNLYINTTNHGNNNNNNNNLNGNRSPVAMSPALIPHPHHPQYLPPHHPYAYGIPMHSYHPMMDVPPPLPLPPHHPHSPYLYHPHPPISHPSRTPPPPLSRPTSDSYLGGVYAKVPFKLGGQEETKIKPSSFPAVRLKIGEFVVSATTAFDVVAKFYYTKKQIIFELTRLSTKYKIVNSFGDIIGIHTNDKGDLTSLTFELSKSPKFYKETNPQPKKNTMWVSCKDFTKDNGSRYRRQEIVCKKSVLAKHLPKLRQSDLLMERLIGRNTFQEERVFFKFEDPDLYPDEAIPTKTKSKSKSNRASTPDSQSRSSSFDSSETSTSSPRESSDLDQSSPSYDITSTTTTTTTPNSIMITPAFNDNQLIEYEGGGGVGVGVGIGDNQHHTNSFGVPSYLIVDNSPIPPSSPTPQSRPSIDHSNVIHHQNMNGYHYPPADYNQWYCATPPPTMSPVISSQPVSQSSVVGLGYQQQQQQQPLQQQQQPPPIYLVPSQPQPSPSTITNQNINAAHTSSFNMNDIPSSSPQIHNTNNNNPATPNISIPPLNLQQHNYSSPQQQPLQQQQIQNNDQQQQYPIYYHPTYNTNYQPYLYHNNNNEDILQGGCVSPQINPSPNNSFSSPSFNSPSIPTTSSRNHHYPNHSSSSHRYSPYSHPHYPPQYIQHQLPPQQQPLTPSPTNPTASSPSSHF